MHATGETSTARPVPSLRGRDGELSALDRLLDRAVEYQAPQVVSLVGGAGVGRSRLLDEWLARVASRTDPPVRALVGRVATDGPPFAPLRAMLRRRFEVVDGEPEEIAAAKVRAALETLFQDRRVHEMACFLGPFVETAMAPSPFHDAVGAQPALRDAVARTVLTRFVERDAEARPLVLAIDDLHLAHADLVALLSELGDGLGGSPIVLVATALPELFAAHPRWGGGSADHTRIDLTPLPRDDAEAMLCELLGVDDLPASLSERAAAVAAGCPLRLVRLAGEVAASGAVMRESGRAWIDGDRAAAAEAPLSVEEALEARVGGLRPEERELLEMGAALGPVFWAGALVALRRLDGTPGDAPSLDDESARQVEWRLEDLVAREVLARLPAGVAGEREYAFQDGALRARIARVTPIDRARRYRLRAAEWLEARARERTEDLLLLLGELYGTGGRPDRAAACFTAAAGRARHRGGIGTAVDLYRRALEHVAADDTLGRLDVLEPLGGALLALGRTREALGFWEELRGRAWRLDAPARAMAAESGLGTCRRALGENDAAVAHLEAAFDLAVRAGDRAAEGPIGVRLGEALLDANRAFEAEQALQAALDAADAAGDPAVCAEATRLLALAERARGA